MRTAALLTAAFILLIVGLSLGLAPSSATGANGRDFSCGSPWNMDVKQTERQKDLDDTANGTVDQKAWKNDYRKRCEDKLDARGAIAWITISLGAVALIGAALTRKPSANSQQESVEPGA